MVVVFATTYALILPAITDSIAHPTLSSDVRTTWSGDELSVIVRAENKVGRAERTFVLIAEGLGAGLSDDYTFDDDSTTVITDEAGREILLHRSVRKNAKATLDYWFTLPQGESTEFRLTLADRVDVEELIRVSPESEDEIRKGEEDEDAIAAYEASKQEEAGTKKSGTKESGTKEDSGIVLPDGTSKVATNSSASKAVKKGTGSNAAKKGTGSNASRPSGSSSQKVTEDYDKDKYTLVTEADGSEYLVKLPVDSDSGELLDGEIINDLYQGDEEDGEEFASSVTAATLKLSAGSGETLSQAVRDTMKSAAKRGDSLLTFRWKEATEHAETLTWSGNGATVELLFDEDANIPADAVLSVRELVPGSNEYNSCLEDARKAAMETADPAVNLSVTDARFFDIEIIVNGEAIEPDASVQVVIRYDESLSMNEEDELNVVHFAAEGTELLKPDAENVSGSAESDVDTIRFTQDSFSVTGTFVLRQSLAGTLTTSEGTYRVTMDYDETACIPSNASLNVREIGPDDPEYAAYYDQAAAAVGAGSDSKGANSGESISFAHFLDITILAADGVTEIEPKSPVQVSIVLVGGQEKDESTEISALHFDEAGDAEVLENVRTRGNSKTLNGVSFKADSFSVYGIVGTVIEKTVLASDGHNYRITVTCGADSGIPEDADLAVEEIPGASKQYKEYVSKTENALGMENGSAGYVRLFDISIVNKNDHSIKYQPEAGTSVDVRIELADCSSEAVSVVHFADESDSGSLVDAEVDGQAVSFEATGFSIYAIADAGENARIGYRFWYYDGTQNVILSTQYFRYKDVHPDSGDAMELYQPSIPGMEAATWNRIFNGWSKSSALTEPLYSLDELNTELSGLSNSDYDESVIDLFANLTNVYYVTYVDVNPNNVLATEIVPKEDEGDTTFTIKTKAELLPTIDSDADLNGWYELEDLNTVYVPGQSGVVIDRDMTLYPSVEGGHWLIFNDNDPVWDAERQQYVSGGASFTPPAFYLDETTVEPDPPTWTGYTFGGWYTTPDCNDGEEFTFGNELTANTTVYAKWIPSASQYRVIIWKQRTSDDVGLADDAKTYDYVTSYLINEGVLTGDIAALDNVYKNIYGSNGTSADTDKAYFVYNNNKTNQSVVVKADGSSVLNVYYDRKPVTLNFYTWGYGYTPTTGNNGTQYGLVDGQYVELTRNGNTWSYVAGTEYSYTRYTGTNEGYYYIPDGNGDYTRVYLYRDNGRWYRTRTGTWLFGYTYSDEYTGDVYTRSENIIRVPYTGTRYRRDTYESWQLYKSFTGLYSSTFIENGYTWPTEYWWYDNGNSYGNISGTRTTVMTAFLPTDVNTSGNAIIKNFYGTTASGNVRINFYVQELDGSYTLREYVGTGGGTFYITDKYIGYHAAQYRANNGTWYNAGTPNSSGYYNNGNGVSYSSALDIRFDLNNYTLTFYTNNGSNQVIEHPVSYSKSLSEYAGQTEGQKNGYYFLGWYADPSCTEPFDFNQTMPDNNIAVYGKWKMIRTRIVIEPGAENVYMGSQAKTFRLNFDERIDGGLLETATRAGYILDGWYTDPEFTDRFLFSNPVNSQTSGVDTTYGTAAHWAAARAAYGDDSEDYDNVRNILHLYAKWILDPDTSGYNVVYDAGDAALRDDLGNLLTTVPVDTRMYAFGNDATPSTREAPSNYNELYSFAYWEATKEDGTKITLYPSDPIPLSELLASETVTDEVTGEVFRKTITLRGVYTTQAGNRITHITYDGDTFTQDLYPSGTREVQGKTNDGTQRVTVTLDKEVNQTITLPDKDDFYLNGYELVGWSFFEGTYDEQIALEEAFNTAHPDNTVTHFEPGAQVAADNLVKNEVNNEGNTLYAMWQPKTYSVTVKQVIESGVPDSTFTYVYNRGPENDLESDQQQALTGNASFGLDDFTYYDISGHVIRIETPVPTDESYDVRVNATVTHDDGTTEILNPTALGNYPILGDVVITYTYSPKAEVKLQKRDAAAHGTTLTGAVFVMTPVEYNTAAGRWENAGDGKDVTISSGTQTLYLQEGTYKISETTAPTGYAAISSELYLTVSKEGEFSLFDSAGNAVDAKIAELDPASKRILTMYDNPIRTVTLGKTVDAANTEGSFSFKITVFDSDGSTRLRNKVIATQNGADVSTDSIGEATVTLSHNESIELKIPNGCWLTVEESANAKYQASYVWNSEDSVDGTIFGITPVEIAANGTLAYTNRLAPVQVVLKKVGVNNTDPAAAETDLSGATFTAYTAVTGGSVAKDADGTDLRGMTSNGDGVFFSGRLLPGKYYLEETGVPAGYYAPRGRFELEVISKDSEPTIKPSWTTGDPNHSAGSVSSSTDAETGVTTYTVSVRNVTGVSLPSTGSHGTKRYYLFGSMLILLAGALLFTEQKRKKIH